MENIFETISKNRNDPSNIDVAVQNVNAKIANENEKVNAVVWQDASFTNIEIERVKKLDSSSPLFGMPILIKELDASLKGTPNSWGNKILKEQGYKDTFTSNSIRLLQEAGAVIVGKTNNCELGLDVITDSSAHGSTKNPHELSQNAGGSSGGSAAAVATGMVRVATGGDGGGSIRIPAAICGVWGYKPSRGRISYGPIIGQAWAGLVSKGLIGASIKEIALVADVMTKPQPGDPYNAHPLHTDFVKTIENDLPKLKIGIRTNSFGNSCEVNQTFIEATNALADYLSNEGHEVSSSSPASYNEGWILENFSEIIAINTAVDFEEMVKRSKGQLKIKDCDGTAQYFYGMSKNISPTQYVNACYNMEFFTYKTAPFFEDFDILITPTISDFGPKDDHAGLNGAPNYNPYTYAGFTAPINFIGGCAISVPISLPGQTLPLAVQIASKRDNDELILQIAHYLECNYSNIYSIS